VSKRDHGPSAAVKCLKLFAVLLGLVGFLGSPALAQTICNSQAPINFPNGDNLNRVVGQSLQMSILLSNGPSLSGGVADSQTFSVVHFFPSCLSVGGGVCTIDPGENAGAPPPIEFIGSLGTDCSIVPGVDTSNPFDIKFNFVPPITLPNAASCLLTFTVRVAERGDLGSTPTNIRQLSSTDGVCGSSLTSSGTGSAQITLTCPPCDDGNVCTADNCDPATALCTHSTPPNCDDGNVCTVDACIGPNPGDCSHSTPPNCDDGNVCTVDACTGPGPNDCSHSTPPSCDDGNLCTVDACTGPNPGDCSHSNPPNCDDSNNCTNDFCDPSTGQCVHEPVTTIPDTCVNESFGLDVDGCAILQLGGGKVDITGPSPGVAGDICVGPGGRISISISSPGTVHGACRLSGSTGVGGLASKCEDGVQTNQDLSQFINECTTASTDLSAKPCDQTFAKLQGPVTVNAIKNGENVICVTGDVTSSGGSIAFSKNAWNNVTFVVNIGGKVSLSGGSDILTDAGSANLILNVGKDVSTSGGGGGASCCNAVIQGSIIAVNGKVALSPGLVQGKICAGHDISIVSGSSVVCEPQVCVP
jgi:Dictyostelium (slime mold) repeat